MMILVLKSDALKERHWKLLMKQLHVSWVLLDLTLGQVWEVNLQKNEAVVTDIILVALEDGFGRVPSACMQLNVHS
jgi:dynein heavy chain 1